MRAVCERCEEAQPIDWKPGDLCVHCGESVRREVRCGWCAKWTPFATFCRNCGAEVVEESLFGAARMLKDAGVDRFTIPKQLATLDPEQIANFSRIYQRHAIVVARHVEQLTFVQRFLRQHHWAAQLEDELIPALPWPEAGLAPYSTAPIDLVDGTPGERVATVRTIQESTPIDITRALAAIARLRLDDWSSLSATTDALGWDDASIRDEASLAITSWRVRTGVGPHDVPHAAIDELRVSAFPVEAAVRLAALTSDDIELPSDAIGSADAETSLGAALLTADVDRLEAALRGDALERSAAACALVRLGVTQRLAPVLRDGPDDVRSRILQEMAYTRKPIDGMGDVLIELIESTTDDVIREVAVRVAAPTATGAAALRIARAGNGNRRIMQSLLQRTELDPDELASILDFLIASDQFSVQQYGMSTIAENGRLADTFVPTRFTAASPAVQLELLALAELQLLQRGDEALHRFVMNVVFGSVGGSMRTTAWWVLHRWYQRQGDYRGEGPLRLDDESVTRFFGGLDTFLPRLTAIVRDIEALNEVAFGDLAANLFTSAEPSFVADVQGRDHDGAELVAALVDGVAAETRTNTNESMIVLLSQLGTRLSWREDALAALRRVDRAGNYHYDKAVRRLVLAEFGLPTDDLFKDVPIDFVPTHFDAVSLAGQREMLEVADQQLIHNATGPDLALLDFLADVAERTTSEDIERRARHIHQDRAPREASSFDRPGW